MIYTPASSQDLPDIQDTQVYDMNQLSNIQSTIDVFNRIITDLTPEIPRNRFNITQKDILDETIEMIVRLV